MKTRITSILLTVLLLVILSSCSNDSEPDLPSTAHMQVILVDDPATYEAIFIDVQGVEYKLEADSAESNENEESEGEENDGEGTDAEEDDSSWYTLDVEPRTYDILTLNNGGEALLADEDIPTGELKQVRLILGSNNEIVVDGDTMDLKVPSGGASGLKINVDGDVEADGIYTLTLDFDAARSIVKTGNGMYLLKPVIRAVLEGSEQDEFGSISGVVSPDSVSSVVYVLDLANEDTLSTTMPEIDGTFMINLLSADSYNVHAVPEEGSGFTPAIEEGVVVTAGQNTAMDTLNLGGE